MKKVLPAIAAAFGSVVCNQTAAISTALAWMLAVENIVPLVVHKPGLRRWLLDGSADRVLHLAHPGPGMAPAWVAARITSMRSIMSGVSESREKPGGAGSPLSMIEV